MGRIGPTLSERRGEHGVIRTGADQRRDVGRMGGRFRRGHESGAHANRIGSGGQRRRHRPAAPDAARSDERQSDGASHFVEECQEPDCASDVSTGLDPLDDDEIAPGVAGGAGFVGRADLPSGPSTAFMDSGDDLGIRLAPKTLDQRAPRRRILETAAVEKGDEEVHSDRDLRRHGIELRSESRRSDGPAEHAKTPGEGDRYCEVGRREPSHTCLLQGVGAAEHFREASRDRHGTIVLASRDECARVCSFD